MSSSRLFFLSDAHPIRTRRHQVICDLADGRLFQRQREPAISAFEMSRIAQNGVSGSPRAWGCAVLKNPG
jgi:hypothetical protein